MKPDKRGKNMKDVYVITGGTGGMAEGIARLAGKDYQLLIAARNKDKLEKRIASLREEGIEAEGFVADISVKSDVEALAKRAAEMGPVKAVAHTAGVSPATASKEDILKINLVGSAYVIDAFYEVIAEGGAIVSTSSIGGHSISDLMPKPEGLDQMLDTTAPEDIPAALEPFFEVYSQMSGGALTAHWTAYGMSKYFMMRYSARNAFRFYRNKKARICTVSPGNFETAMGLAEKANGGDQAQVASPIERFGHVPEVAAVIVFLTSDQASYVTGVDWLVDGGAITGMSMAPIA